ncbi:DUF5134 domain-containing protein [Saccharomonospora xinjiangensis]|uniref:DUF5134 domain-containing protein n=1 Tax=Saccharomonospora xinjiangensis XJ-54 TaxID=882086 RepID=I0V722_9PSEU|nr:DUF5134 domain-containing protein [Saccharomonospora xinjiangensis]EID55925.1 hypothetical protein SacxiDRAFT_3732 [Saccharomonospora xinjiangensis XJ-54]
MGIPTAVAWGATAVFGVLLRPCLSRLVRLDYATLGAGTRQADVAGLLMAVAMLAMVSPVGFPVPVAGWQALLAVTACWFLAAALRERAGRGVCRGCDLHHGVSAAAMVYMLAAMPHGDAGHSVWPTMVGEPVTGTFVLPAVAAVLGLYFAGDVAATVRRVVRVRRGDTRPPAGVLSRFGCRAVMSAGMALMFAAGLAG